ncbi:hypothetical protein CHS0354_026026 [Potamilus streckersoni]|uniref:Uncharacterized protein n=1 Tax=Potamilus streckersoni TaxID=2493646 RepID=A0AAE0SBM1_9BIVA|nr:hypothetical protein CHS0354_026026 [Potamilus streckersoni]
MTKRKMMSFLTAKQLAKEIVKGDKINVYCAAEEKREMERKKREKEHLFKMGEDPAENEENRELEANTPNSKLSVSAGRCKNNTTPSTPNQCHLNVSEIETLLSHC